MVCLEYLSDLSNLNNAMILWLGFTDCCNSKNGKREFACLPPAMDRSITLRFLAYNILSCWDVFHRII